MYIVGGDVTWGVAIDVGYGWVVGMVVLVAVMLTVCVLLVMLMMLVLCCGVGGVCSCYAVDVGVDIDSCGIVVVDVAGAVIDDVVYVGSGVGVCVGVYCVGGVAVVCDGNVRTVVVRVVDGCVGDATRSPLHVGGCPG